MAGLPGTGLGGLFYALLTIFVAVREAYLTYRRRSNAGRRSLTLRMFAFVMLIVATFWVEGFVVMQLVGSFNAAYAFYPTSQQDGTVTQVPDVSSERMPAPVFQPVFRPVPEAIVPALAWTPFIFLGFVLGAVQILRAFVLLQARSSKYR